MIEINKESPEIRTLLNKYLVHTRAFFGIKPENENATKEKDRSKFQNLAGSSLEPLYSDMLQYFHNHFNEIVLAEPDTLKKIQTKLLKALCYKEDDPKQLHEFDHFKKTMTGYYEELIQEKFDENGETVSLGRWLTRSLGLSVCPFCNHNYTLTVNDIDNNIVVKPDFDHFYSKANFPLLAVSFFNLVPICGTCNKLKGEDEVFQNPYDPSHPRPKFRVYGKNKKGEHVLFGLGDSYEQFEVFPEAKYSQDNEETCNVKRLGLKQIYDQHIDHVSELIDQAQQYNAGTYSAMIESFQGLGKTEGEIDRIIWGRYKDQPHKRPLSKLTSDVLDQIGLKEY